MPLVISSVLPFPNLHWWSLVLGKKLLLDRHEHFEKMTYRNRYYLAGANGLLKLSIPLEQGRDQRLPMTEVRICNKERWQVNHWRSIESAYRRPPYFEHYEPSLKALFEQPFELLSAFNLASMLWLKQELGAGPEISFTESYQKHYEDAIDLRKTKPGTEIVSTREEKHYFQLFEKRNGFIKNLSALDMLFIEGPYALEWLKNQ